MNIRIIFTLLALAAGSMGVSHGAFFRRTVGAAKLIGREMQKKGTSNLKDIFEKLLNEDRTRAGVKKFRDLFENPWDHNIRLTAKSGSNTFWSNTRFSKYILENSDVPKSKAVAERLKNGEQFCFEIIKKRSSAAPKASAPQNNVGSQKPRVFDIPNLNNFTNPLFKDILKTSSRNSIAGLGLVHMRSIEWPKPDVPVESGITDFPSAHQGHIIKNDSREEFTVGKTAEPEIPVVRGQFPKDTEHTGTTKNVEQSQEPLILGKTAQSSFAPIKGTFDDASSLQVRTGVDNSSINKNSLERHVTKEPTKEIAQKQGFEMPEGPEPEQPEPYKKDIEPEDPVIETDADAEVTKPLDMRGTASETVKKIFGPGLDHSYYLSDNTGTPSNWSTDIPSPPKKTKKPAEDPPPRFYGDCSSRPSSYREDPAAPTPRNIDPPKHETQKDEAPKNNTPAQDIQAIDPIHNVAPDMANDMASHEPSQDESDKSSQWDAPSAKENTKKKDAKKSAEPKDATESPDTSGNESPAFNPGTVARALHQNNNGEMSGGKEPSASRILPLNMKGAELKNPSTRNEISQGSGYPFSLSEGKPPEQPSQIHDIIIEMPQDIPDYFVQPEITQEQSPKASQQQKQAAPGWAHGVFTTMIIVALGMVGLVASAFNFRRGYQLALIVLQWIGIVS